MTPPPPFRLDLTALALVRRPNNRIDTWRGGTYARWVPARDPHGSAPVSQFLLEVSSGEGNSHRRPEGSGTERLLVRATGSLDEPELARLAERAVTQMFGLDVDMAPFYALASGSAELGPLVERLRGLRPPRYPGVFQALLNAVPCQQVTLVLGLRLLEGLARTYGLGSGGQLEPDEGGPLPLPGASALATARPEALTALGLSRAKARTLIELSQACVTGELDLAALQGASNEAVSERLQQLFGIGRWTADYVLLRGLGRLDVFPHGDSGARNGLARFVGAEGKPSYEWVAQTVAPWQPYAGFVYLHLLVNGMVRTGEFGAL